MTDAKHDAGVEHGAGEIAGARVLVPPRREALLALIPLGVIVLGFITPPILPRALYDYPARVVPESPWSDGASPLWSIHIVALLLGALTLVHARRRSAPGIRARVVAVAGLLAVLHLPAAMLYFALGDVPALAVSSGLVLVATVALVVIAFRRAGWAGWLCALAAYAVAALPYACPLFPGVFNEFCGGLTFVAADLTLLALTLVAARR